jgi:UDP-N-acetyl-D-mannosaminuronate dehydrogenase
MRVGIIGLGYVGLPLAVDAALVVDFRGVTRGIAAHNLIRL